MTLQFSNFSLDYGAYKFQFEFSTWISPSTWKQSAPVMMLRYWRDIREKKQHLQCFTLCVLDEAERLALQQWMTGNHSGTENGVPQKVPGPRRNFLRLKRTQGRKSTNLWHQIRSWASSIFPTLSHSEHDLSTYGRRQRRSAKLHN